MSAAEPRVGHFGTALGQWQNTPPSTDPSHRWTLQRFDEGRGVFRDVSTTDSAVKADQVFRQGPEWRVLDNEIRDIAAEYVPYRVGHVVAPLTYRDALWQAEYAPRSRFAQEIEAEVTHRSADNEALEGPRP